MKANEANFLALLANRRQFAIPIYQRTYSWGEKNAASYGVILSVPA